ncbi:MAG: PAS domain-containing protein [Thermoanaerobacteraceae bacterium]|nr:PAS domain-containing protein [Thermoanaerobacteraceae bacterium]
MELITTNEARCRDCYRCLRSCAVKAIRFTGGESGALHARVIDELCVQDARCVLSCPQKAKKVASDLEQVRRVIREGQPVAAGVAPSFVAAFPLEDPGQMPALLKKLGFVRVQETSLGAELVARTHRQPGFDRSLISSACPVVVNLIERYYPGLLPMLAPVVSPMIAHGRLMKKMYPGYRTVFIGPCVAKKAEARVEGIDDAIDYVLGFDELYEWMQEEGIDAADLPPGDFDGPRPGLARLFPIEGGLIATLQADTGEEEKYLTITGLQNCMSFLDNLSRKAIPRPPLLMELLACRGGCIDGPLSLCREQDLFTRRRKVREYFRARAAREGPPAGEGPELSPSLMHREYADRQVSLPLPDEQTIRRILARTGKYQPEDELNCGACGYDSCRDKAIAVYQGNAEVQMCIPYMRKRAESTSNLVMAAMPNALIIVDHRLVIKEVNPAAERMFRRPAREMLGQHLDKFINPENFIKVLETGEMLNRIHSHPELDLITRDIIFPLDSERAVVGILVDITADKRQQERFELVKVQTITRAREVINKQMTVAQEIAGLLGETTAETKVLLSKLIDLMEKESL